jgi:hypothetical protein
MLTPNRSKLKPDIVEASEVSVALHKIGLFVDPVQY